LKGKLLYTVIHSLPGRVRVRVEALRDPILARRFADWVGAQNGIIKIHVNSACASATITYDDNVLSLSSTMDGFDEARALPADPSQILADSEPPRKPGFFSRCSYYLDRALNFVESKAPAGLQLIVGGAAFAAAVFQFSTVLTRSLLALSVVPIAARAIRTIHTEKRLGVDALDGVAAGIMLAQGNLIAAGFMSGLIALGEYIRECTAQRCRRMMHDLLGLAGRSAWIVKGKKRICVPADQVIAGDVVVVYAGEMIPVDGIVIGGTAEVDQSSLTGESAAVDISAGSPSWAATIVLEGKLYIRCTAAGAETRAGIVLDLVNSAPLHETRVENYASRVADRLVLPIFISAAACFAITRDLTRTLSMLIFDFATGLRIAAPTAVLASMQRAARHGILIKSGGALERLATVDAVLFDKTGTLTTGEPHVTEVISLNGVEADRIVCLAAAVEQRLHHPAARAIVRHARKQGLAIPDRMESSNLRGMGVQAKVDEDSIIVGNRRLMEDSGICMTNAHASRQAIIARGESLAYIAINGELSGIIAYRDQLRPESKRVVRDLHRAGIKEIVMATGDMDAPAAAVARAVGIDRVQSGAFPEQKAEMVSIMKASGRRVAVVGDGINDSPALAHADVAVSLHGGTDAARESADVVLTDDDLRRLPEAIQISREAMALVEQTIALVAIPNALGLCLAATGMIGPAMSTLLNNGFAIVAALNSLSPLYSDPLPVEELPYTA
jgi:heavy metal translocating P-type ATPase